jgi:hypothetical protein
MVVIITLDKYFLPTLSVLSAKDSALSYNKALLLLLHERRELMKKLLMAVAMLALGASFAQARDGYAARYTTTYETWDRGFSGQYSYRETAYSSCGYYTCYDGFGPRDSVYVEETIIQNGTYRGYTRVTVYNDRRYNSNNRYVTYYTHNGRVVHREYYRSNRYYSNRTYTHVSYTTVNYVYLDEFTAGIILGMEFVNLGATVLASCEPGDDACVALGLASSVSGSLISISASEREQERTELQRRIEAQGKREDSQNLDDSLDLE